MKLVYTTEVKQWHENLRWRSPGATPAFIALCCVLFSWTWVYEQYILVPVVLLCCQRVMPKPFDWAASVSRWRGDEPSKFASIRGFDNVFIVLSWEDYLDKFTRLEAKCREKTLEKSGLEIILPNCLADRKHCALSTQPIKINCKSPSTSFWAFKASL